VEFFFQPADMVTQILNFGLPSAIDVKITGADLRIDYEIAAKLMKQIEMIPGTVGYPTSPAARSAYGGP